MNNMKLLTHKEVAARLAMKPAALRMALYRGQVPLKPIFPEVSGRKGILYLESEVDAYIQSLVEARDRAG